MSPVELPPNRIRRFYRGGARIAAFRGLESRDDDAPEDWVGSTTTAHGEAALGLSRLADGTLVRDRFGHQQLLVKLLDAGERLPLHLHPDDAFAREHLGSPCGKTEAWIVLEAEPGAEVGLGFARDVPADELAQLFADQDVDAMLAAMTMLPARAGDTFFVPAGLPHVIGRGILLLELQQPSDLSMLLERGRTTEREAWLGLAPDLGLGAVDRSGWEAARLERLTSGRGSTLFPEEADVFFRADRVSGGAALEPGFAILVVVEGDGAVGELPVGRGSTVLVPPACGEVELSGAFHAVRCRPPVP